MDVVGVEDLVAGVLVLVREVPVWSMGRAISGVIRRRRIVVIGVGAKVTRLIVVSMICLLTSRIPSWAIVSPLPHHPAATFISDPPPSSPPHAHAGLAFTSHRTIPVSVSFGDFNDFDHFPQDSGSEDEEYTEVIPYEGGLGSLHT